MKNRIKHILGKSPILFNTSYRGLGSLVNQNLIVSEDTDIVIEGYPRSANTYFVVSFEHAQNYDIKIAHHLHVESQLIYAVKKGIPAVALIRNPEDCIKSLLVRHPETHPVWAIKRYIYFYSSVLRIREGCFVANYEDIITDVGNSIMELNKYFNKDYSIPIVNEKSTDIIFNKIDKINAAHDSGKDTHVARPNLIKQTLKQGISLKKYSSYMNEAYSIYSKLTR